MLWQKTLGATAARDPDLVLVFDTSLYALSVDVPFGSAAVVDVTVDWGDGSSDVYTTNGTKTHTYASDGIYTVRISGSLSQFGAETTSSVRDNLIKCLSFGDLGLVGLDGAFRNCGNLTEVPNQIPSTVTSLARCFLGALLFNQDISSWNTSNVTDMQGAFNTASVFNQPLNSWDLSNVTTTANMFQFTSAFNQDISGWDVGNVLNMNGMFQGTIAFNQDISAWNTTNVTNMRALFNGATVFNQDIGPWDTVNVTNMALMFNEATAFNQDLSGWCVGNIQSEPTDFATNSALTTGNKPVWGTCPTYVADGSITYVGEATGVTSATLPTHEAGDVIIAFVFRDGSTAQATMPSGWTSIGTAGANTCAARLAYKVAESSSETTGTWTNATTTIFTVYRGVDITNITGVDTNRPGFGTNVIYNVNGFWQGLSRMTAFAGHRSIDVSLGTPPGDLSLIVSAEDFTDDAAAFQSTVDNYGDWAETSVDVGGTASGWITFTLRLRVPITLAP